MAEQIWVTSSLGGYLAAPFLSKEVRMQAQPLQRFRQFCVLKEELGKGKGDTILIDKIGDTADAGGTLVETNTMPTTTVPITQTTLTVNEYGNAIAA